MTERKPMVSVIIACLNEEEYIVPCLESIIANDYPKDRLEVLVVDGISEDGTREMVEELAWHKIVDHLEDKYRAVVFQ